MGEIRDLVKSSLTVKKSLLVALTVALMLTVLCGSASSQVNKNGKQRIVQRVAEKWIQVGQEQFKKGYYKAAEQSFLRALDYKEYLVAGEIDKLDRLLEKSHEAAVERDRLLEAMRKAERLLLMGNMAEAKGYLENARDSEYLTADERKMVAEKLEGISGSLSSRQREEAELYNRSVAFYRAGELEKARKGFLKISQTGSLAAPEGKGAEDYLVKIDGLLAREAEKALAPKVVEEITPTSVEDEVEVIVADEIIEVAVVSEVVEEAKAVEVEEHKPVAVAVVEREPEAEGAGYIKVINRRRNIIRSHTNAVISEAVSKVNGHVGKGEFEKADDAVAAARQVVNNNSTHLGDELYKGYSLQLNELSGAIAVARAGREHQLRELRQTEAIKAQEEFRQRMAVDREKRVSELLENALNYQRQQRYEEALGQLESLLALEPRHNHALIQKQMLEDTIGFRKQLEVAKKAGKERGDILLKTDETGIPYADELTYPKNWLEIDAKRKPEEVIGKDPANMVVYKQLDEIVDLSEFSPEMPLGEAMEILKNSVEPGLKVTVNWRDLSENADIDQSTPINMDPLSAIPLGTGLEFLLESVSGGLTELGYLVTKGVVKVATEELLQVDLETRVYDASVLLGRPADFYASSGGSSGGGGSRGGGGGGGGGGGSSRGGGGGSSRGRIQEYIQSDEEDLTRDELASEASERAENLTILLQESIEPDSWFDAGGEGTVTIYDNKKLVIRQTRTIHDKVEKLLREMRKALGHQVSIEARFLMVGENFLEDIGLDVDITWQPPWKNMGIISFDQGSSASTRPPATGVLGSLGEDGLAASKGIRVKGDYGSVVLNGLEVNFLLRATQAHKDSKSLIAPKITVLSGERASYRQQRTIRYPEIPDITTRDREGGFSGYSSSSGLQQNYNEVITGTILNITPTITPDKKHVLLNIVTELRDFLGFEDTEIEIPNLASGVAGVGNEPLKYTVTLPQTEISRIKTRVSVPDGGTLLLGGQKITAEVERESGVPIMSKLPIIGRMFSNRSKIKDHKILLILVKPTIILQEETDAEASGGLLNGF